jgi:protein tyrosine/serine phosphatase
MHKHSHNKDFKSLLNFRDIGGVPTSGMRLIREGIIFRSANPDRISKDDLEKLGSLNIRSVIDLRAPGELGKKYKSVDHAYKLTLPLDFQKTTRERLRPVIYKKDAQNVIADISNDLYLEILDASGPAFRQVMELLASPGRSPVLIHCHAGKDRTGIIIALILMAMGVDRNIIISDFMKSNEALMPFFKSRFLIRKIISFGFFPYRNMVFAVEVKQRNIESVLDRVEFHYGGIEGYLRYSGYDMSSLQKVKDVLIKE